MKNVSLILALLFPVALCPAGLADQPAKQPQGKKSQAAAVDKSAAADNSDEDPEASLVTKVYRTDNILPALRDYPARRLNDLGDGRSLFNGNQDPPMLDDLTPRLVVPSEGYGDFDFRLDGRRLRMAVAPNTIPAENGDTLTDVITGVISPKDWEAGGGLSTIAPMNDLLVVRTTEKNHAAIRQLLDAMSKAAASRPAVTVEAHWLWLTQEDLKRIVPALGGDKPDKGLAVDETAWRKFWKPDADEEPSEGLHAILTCFNGQTAFVAAGGQQRFIITMIPVVGAFNGILSPVVPESKPTTPPSTTTVTPYVPTPASERGVGYMARTVTVQEGAALEVRPMVAGKEIVLDLRSRVVEVTKVVRPERRVSANGGQAGAIRENVAAIDRPQLATHRLETTVRAPAARRILVGGASGEAHPSADDVSLYLFIKATRK